MPVATSPILSFSLHLRPISRMERLSIESCLAAGYSHTAYVYGGATPWLGALPVPAKYFDAAAILPKRYMRPDASGSFQRSRLRFMCTAMFQHGGIWIDNDYVLTQAFPDTPLLAIASPDRHGFTDFALRLPAGSAIAQLAMNFAETALADVKDPTAVLMDSIKDNWPERHAASVLSASQGCPFSEKQAAAAISPAPDLDQTGVYGYKLWRDAWECEDCTPATKFTITAPYEQLWGRYFGMRADGVERSLIADMSAYGMVSRTDEASGTDRRRSELSSGRSRCVDWADLEENAL
jgi:hypothetical protein